MDWTAAEPARRRGNWFAMAMAVCLVGAIALSCSTKSPTAAVHASPSASPTPPRTVTVTVEPAGFTPATVTTTVETNIIWFQLDSKTHAITSGIPGKPDGKFDSGPLAKGASFTLVLHSAGTYKYFDKNFPTVTGEVVIAPH